MFNLILNENMKIYRRLRTWILLVLLVVITCTVSIIVKNVTATNYDDNWREQTQQSVERAKQDLEQPGIPQIAKEEIAKQAAIGQYRLDYNLPPTNDTWSGVMTMANLVQFVTIFTVIIAADMVAGEFAQGTIKLLLIRPASRAKILLSKYFATLMFAVCLLVVLFITAFIVNGVLYGFKGIGVPYLYATKEGIVHEVNMLGHVLGTYGLKCIELLMIVTLAFMISTVFRSSSLAIGISLLIMFVGSSIVMFLTKYSWIKYYLFANTDLTQHIEGRPIIEGMTMSFSITVLIVYFILFNALSWTIFKKRDVAA